MLDWILSVNSFGEIGSKIWGYDITTIPGQTIIGSAGYVEARLLKDHYMLREEQGGWTKPPFDILDRNDIQKVDEKLKLHLRKGLARFIKSYKDHRIIIIDNSQILGDISDLVS